MAKISNKIENVGLFQEKSKQEVRGYTFLKSSLEFSYFSIYPKKIQRKYAFISGNSAKLNDTSTKFQDQKPIHMEITFFLYTPGSSTSFLIDSWHFHMFFHQYHWNFHVLNPHSCFDFFWNSPFWGVMAKNIPKSNLKLQFLLVQKHLKI